MNIQTAAQYMKHGYRSRRILWDEGEYLYDTGYFIYSVGLVNSGTNCKKPFYSDWVPTQKDLVADDWVIITEGIISDFGYVTYKDN